MHSHVGPQQQMQLQTTPGIRGQRPAPRQTCCSDPAGHMLLSIAQLARVRANVMTLNS